MPRSTRMLHAAAAITILLPAASAHAAGWTTAVPLPGPAATGAGAPQVAAAPAGAVTVAWRSGGVIHVSDRAADGTFGPAQAVSGGGVQSDPLLAVGAGGRAVVTWKRGGVLEAAVRPGAGAAFDTPAAISGADPGDVSVAVGADGRVAVAWVRGSIVQVAERTAAQTAWPASLQTFNENEPGFTGVAVAPDGRVTVVWSAKNGIDPRQRSASKPAGGAWSVASWGEPVALDSMGPVPVFAAADDTGAVTALWASRTGWDATMTSTGHPVITAGRSVAGGGFGGVSVSDGPTTVAGGSVPVPSLSVAGSGDAAAVWTRPSLEDDARAVPEIAVRAGSGGSWGAPHALEATALADRYARPDVALDPAGRPVAVWQRADGTIAGDRSAGGWAGPKAISAAGASDPQVAVDAAGNGVAVWVRGGALESATYDLAAPEPGGPGEKPGDGGEKPGDGGEKPGGGGDKPGGATTGGGGTGGTSTPRTTTPTAPLRFTALTLTPKTLRAGNAARLTFTASASARVTIRVQRRSGTKWKTTRTLVTRVSGRATATLPRTALRTRGSYRVTLTAGTVTATKAFRVR